MMCYISNVHLQGQRVNQNQIKKKHTQCLNEYLALNLTKFVDTLGIEPRLLGRTAHNLVKPLGTKHPIYRSEVPLLPRVHFLYI